MYNSSPSTSTAPRRPGRTPCAAPRRVLATFVTLLFQGRLHAQHLEGFSYICYCLVCIGLSFIYDLLMCFCAGPRRILSYICYLAVLLLVVPYCMFIGVCVFVQHLEGLLVCSCLVLVGLLLILHSDVFMCFAQLDK